MSGAALAAVLSPVLGKLSETGIPFGLRTVVTALAALWLAMWLQLDTPRWAAWTVMSLALPTRGQVGVKGAWRAAGTILGAIAAVVAIALFAQRPIALGVVVAAWCGLNSYVGGRLPGLASYGAALSSLTAALVVGLSAAAPLSVFGTALMRAVEITLGVACVYVASALAEALHGPRPGPAFSPGPSPDDGMVAANAVRAVLVVGYNLSFLVTVEPLNPMQYDLAASLNEALAIAAGLAFGAAAYRWVLPDRVWRLAR